METRFLKSLIVGASCSVSMLTCSAVCTDLSASALNLTGGGTGTTNGGDAVFTTIPNNGVPAGSGVINSFLRLQSPGNSATEEGFNTDFRSNGQPPLDGVSGNFTRNLLLGDVPVVSGFRQFLLDANEPGGNWAGLDLTDLKIYLSNTPSLSSLAGLTPIFSLAETVSFNVNPGSGRFDLQVDIANSLFTGAATQNLYLYSKFANAQGGFEEWSVRTPAHGGGGDPEPVPTPALLPGLFGMGLAALRKKRQQAHAASQG
jgi:hypothetical protein